MTLVEKLKKNQDLSDAEFSDLIESSKYNAELFDTADKLRRQYYGRSVFLRGLIEFTNFCRNNCFYCGLRRSNYKLKRYRLSFAQIEKCCEYGYALGYRTFVLQGGEDIYFTEEKITNLISIIKAKYPNCAITLSIGEHSENAYRKWFKAGAERYLLRHETASSAHYFMLHPPELSLKKRINCLKILKQIGYQIGAGFMVGAPYQSLENIIADLRFLKSLSPDMAGIGPFISHKDTPFASFPNGSAELTLKLLAIIRLLLPHILLPATTALSTISPKAREKALRGGANVIMPNLSPLKVRGQYSLYDNKAYSGSEGAEGIEELKESVEQAGYFISSLRGDVRRVCASRH